MVGMCVYAVFVVTKTLLMVLLECVWHGLVCRMCRFSLQNGTF